MTFVKGQSGNPSGRPKANKELVELCRKHTAEAINKILELMRHAEKPDTQLAAAKTIIERGHGKATEHIEISGPDETAIPFKNVDAPPQETREQWEARKKREQATRKP